MKEGSAAPAGEHAIKSRPGAVQRAITCLFPVFLAACGGGSGSEDSIDTTVPEDTTAPSSDVYNLGATPQDVIDLCMSDEDKRMLTLVNDARADVRSCGTDYFAAAEALSWHCTLADVAFMHSLDMGSNNFFSHTGSDGLSVGDRVTDAGYVWATVGENIAAGYATVEDVMNGWLASPGHCANIMHPGYTEFGSASYEEPDSDYAIYWTQVFARPLD